LLALNGATEGEITYFLKEPPAKAIIPQKLPKKLQDDMKRDSHKPTKGKHFVFVIELYQ
jgi:hypothetical protein